MNKRFLIYMAVVAAIAIGIYAYVGGFAQVKVAQTTSKQLFIAGRYFEGPTDAEELGSLYQQVGQLVEKKQLVGELAGIYYNNPKKETKTVKAFIGIAIPDTTVTLPTGFQVRVVPAGEPILEGQVAASLMVAPKKLYNALFDYAEEHHLKLREFYVERYPSQDSGIVQVGLQQ